MIIEFLYMKIKMVIFLLQLPCYICNQALFVSVALINETLRAKFTIDLEAKIVKGNEESQVYSRALVITLALNLFFVLI